MSLVVALILALVSPHDITSFTGSYVGSIRNASGTAGLGLADAVNTTITIENSKDSLFVRAVSRAGRNETLGAWSLKNVRVTDTGFTTTGRSSGPVEHRRSMRFELVGGIRMSAEMTMRGGKAKGDEYFGGDKISLTAMKVR